MQQNISTPMDSKTATHAIRAANPAMHSEAGLLSIVVGIATRGRAAVLIETLQDLSGQTRPADRIIVSYTEARDIGDARSLFPEIIFFESKPGLTSQRNTILRALEIEDVVVFLDDDFYLRPDYLAKIERVFADHPTVVVATGKVLADGINGAGLTLDDARHAIQVEPEPEAEETLRPVFNAYGCNMALRLEPIRNHALRFDEALPLYGWYEDVDFSRQVARYGRVVQVQTAHGVHLGVKGGRQSGLRLGYSQIANPFYLARKGSVSWLYASASMLSRSLKNLVMCTRPEPFVDRRGRLNGNILGWRELFSGKSHPTRIMEL